LPLPNPPAAVHWPLTGSLIVTLDAVTAVSLPDAGVAVADASALRTLTQAPAFRSDAVPDACLVNFVASA
jgi:hypothetical protein